MAEEQIEEWLRSKRALRKQREMQLKAERDAKRQEQIDDDGDDTSLDSNGLPNDRDSKPGPTDDAPDDLESTDSSLYSSSDSDDGGQRDGDLEVEDDGHDDVDDVVANQLKDIGDDLRTNKLNEMDIATIGTNELSEAQKEQQLMGSSTNLGTCTAFAFCRSLKVGKCTEISRFFQDFDIFSVWKGLK